MSQTERILYIDKKLRLSGKVTVFQVAEHFEVSVRQVKRDIEYLRDRFNAPIIYDRLIKAYKYEEKFTDLEFADQNLMMSYLALQSITKNQHFMPVYAENMLDAIKVEVSSDYRELCSKISYELPVYETIKSDYFEDICSSMRDRHCLDIVYINLKGEESRRKIEVHRLINYSGSWYAVSFDCTKKDFRIFHLSRILSMSLTEEKFSVHPKQFEEQLDNFVKGYGIFHSNTTETVKIRFFNTAMRIVSTQTWHSQQKVTQGNDGKADYLEFSFPASEFTEIVNKLLSFGSDAVPVYPEALVDLWKKQIVKLYESIAPSKQTESRSEQT